MLTKFRSVLLLVSYDLLVCMCVCVYVFVGIKGDKSSKGEEILLGRDLELLLIQLISGSYFVTHVVSSCTISCHWLLPYGYSSR